MGNIVALVIKKVLLFTARGLPLRRRGLAILSSVLSGRGVTPLSWPEGEEPPGLVSKMLSRGEVVDGQGGQGDAPK